MPRIAITGRKPRGKSTLPDILCGSRTPDADELRRAPGLEAARSFQLPRAANGRLRDLLAADELDQVRFRQVLGVLGVAADVFDTPLSTFDVLARRLGVDES